MTRSPLLSETPRNTPTGPAIAVVGPGGSNIASPLVSESYDYIAVTYPTATTEVYTFKTGGSGGTTVATVTLTYTASDKENLYSVART